MATDLGMHPGRADPDLMNRNRLLLGIPIALLFMAVGGVLTFQHTVDQRWEAMRTWVDTKRKAWESRTFDRPPLWGERRPGSAWEVYHEALAAARAHSEQDQSALVRLTSDPGHVSGEEELALQERWREPLAHLREGAHRPDTRPFVDWTKIFTHDISNLLTARALVNAARLEARKASEQGRTREAVELLLDAMTLGSDYTRTPFLIEEMIGTALVAIALEGCSADALDPLAREDLTLLAAGLEQLDKQLSPIAESLDEEALLLGHHILHIGLDDQLSFWSTWRYGFSTRLTQAMCMHDLADMHDDLRATESLPWPNREKRLQHWNEWATDSGNPLIKMIVPNTLVAERSKRELVASMRMLRMEVAWRLGVAVPALQDPMGIGPLLFEENEDGVTITSQAQRRGKPMQRAVPPR